MTGSTTSASIGEALAQIKVTTTKKTQKMLEPWEIFRLVTANTPKKKALYKELRQAWSALEAANTRLAAGDLRDPQAPEEADAQVKERLARTSFAPEDVERTIYIFEIEGKTVTLSDRVDSWATRFEVGLVEADRAVKTKLAAGGCLPTGTGEPPASP